MGVLKLILAVTLAVEAAVAAVITLQLHVGYGEPLGPALWHGVFHAVSAFNNAGFSTYSDGLVGFAADPVVLVPVMLAIMIGGIGFPVLFEMHRQRGGWSRWSVHTRLTLAGTAFLLWRACWRSLRWSGQPHAGRRRGRRQAPGRRVPVGECAHGRFQRGRRGRDGVGNLGRHYVLMFIGGGSAGTAGGIKVTTFFLLGLVVWAEVRGERDVTAFNRRIAADAQRQALTVALLGVAVLAFATLALMALTALPLEVLMFEAISAFATVGLSTGITAQSAARRRTWCWWH